MALACSRKLRRTDIILWAVALAGEGAAAVGYSTQWAFSNAYIPAVFFPVLAASVLSGRLLLHAFDCRRWLLAVPTSVVLLSLAWQNQHIARPKLAAFIPQTADYVAAGRLLDRLASVPGDLFIPFHTYYAPPHTHKVSGTVQRLLTSFSNRPSFRPKTPCPLVMRSWPSIWPRRRRWARNRSP